MKYKLLISLFFIFTMSYSQLEKSNYTDGSQKLEGLYISSKKENLKNKGVIILPAWMGIDEHAKESAEKLADLGYHAFVADIYGTNNNPKNTTEAGKLSSYFKNDYKTYQKRIQLALEQFIKHGVNPAEVVIIGYCFGGTGALEAARGNLLVKGVVSFHGGLSKDKMRLSNPIQPKILVLHGADDPFIPQTDIANFQDEMRTSKADWQMNYYSNAVHAFTDKSLGTDNSKGAAYNKNADLRSWEAMIIFFEEIFN